MKEGPRWLEGNAPFTRFRRSGRWSIKRYGIHAVASRRRTFGGPVETVPPDRFRILHEVWHLEAGRCQVCGRLMNYRVAQCDRYNPNGAWVPDNPHLLCPLCALHRLPPFAQTEASPACAR